MDDDDTKVNIKPGIFALPSKISDFGQTYKGLHSDDSLSLSYLEEEIEENDTMYEKTNNNNESSSMSSNLSNQQSGKKKRLIKKKSSKLNAKDVPYMFTWDEGGKEIKITGTFGKWTTFYEMQYDPKEKIFKCLINLPREKHEYKFIVDGIWRYSKKQQIKKDDKNNTNNFIDLTNYTSEKKTKNKSSKGDVKDMKEKIKKHIKKEKNKKKIIKKKRDRGYGLVYPNKDALNSEAPMVPQDYHEKFLIDTHTNQNFIGRSKFLSYKITEPFTEEKSYKTLMIGPHININHSLKCIRKKNLLEMGINFRFRDKNCTLVYYSHVPKEEQH
jgi:5'-AMP-activated protein kinase regulatory beta subunit